MKGLRRSVPWMIASLAGLGVLGAMIYGGRAQARGSVGPRQESQSLLSIQTRRNLNTAMHGEAFAYVKYMLYAEQARKNGHPELAALFESTAKTERFEHFAEEAELAGLVGSDEDNLRDAIAGESYEVKTMYPDFADLASSHEDSDAAERFSEILKDEMNHRDAYQRALEKLQKQSSQPR